MSQATLGGEPFHNANLFSNYYLTDRIGDLDGWDCDSEATEAFEKLQTLWEFEGGLVDSYGEDELLASWIDRVLEVLGVDWLAETTLPDGGGYTDRLLFDSPETRREAARRKQDGEPSAAFGPTKVNDPERRAVLFRVPRLAGFASSLDPPAVPFDDAQDLG